MENSNIEISFVGQNSYDVTGSCIHIKTPSMQILLECGLWQSASDTLGDYKINSAEFDFKPSELDYVFINHCHIDHCGRLPLLYKRGAKCKTIIPKGNFELMSLLLEDSAGIAEADALDLFRQYGKGFEPVYSQRDVDKALDMIEEYPFEKPVTLNEHLAFRFVPSGHIVNSAQLELWITEDGITKKILYTSDLGNIHIESNYVRPFEPVEDADLVIGESTYGGETRVSTQESRDEDVEELKYLIEQTCNDKKGRVLIPVFANQRLQQMMTIMYDAFKDKNMRFPIIIDTPLGTRICEAYTGILKGKDAEKWAKVVSWDKFIFTVDPLESKYWMKSDSPAVIFASSGMMTNGRSRGWCEELMGKTKNTIIFCGYAVEDSLAAIIKSGRVKRIKFHGNYVENKFKVVDLHSFSSHMQRDSLVDYYSSIQAPKTVLVHGDYFSKQSLAYDIGNRFAESGLENEVICCAKKQKIML